MITRRSFLAMSAAVPIAARLDAQTLAAGTKPRVVVVGAGAFGGWTALHLHNLGCAVTLLDAWGPGNTRASSGGETRVIRAIYGPDRIYVEMVKRAYEWWDRLNAPLSEPIYIETGALWMHRGDDAYVRAAVPILRELGFPVEQFSIDEAKRRYPQIDFNGVKTVWLEHRAGALSARRACGVVRDEFVRGGGTYRTASAKPGAITNDAMQSIELEDGSRLEADAFVFACGPWLGRIIPDVIGERVRPSRQEVYYFGPPRGSTQWAPPQMPVWIDFGERIVYGIPDVNSRGFKVADDTRGEAIDPTTANRTPTAESIARARKLLSERFPGLAKAPLVASEVCQYENSPDGNLILDRHPHAKNVWLVGGGSGHGFKLSPTVGEMTAQEIVNGKEAPKLFRLDRLRELKTTKTQFDTKN